MSENDLLLDEMISKLEKEIEHLKGSVEDLKLYSERKIEKFLGLATVYKKDMESILLEISNYENMLRWLKELKQYRTQIETQ